MEKDSGEGKKELDGHSVTRCILTISIKQWADVRYSTGLMYKYSTCTTQHEDIHSEDEVKGNCLQHLNYTRWVVDELKPALMK